MHKYLRFAAIALLASAAFVACDDEDNTSDGGSQPSGSGDQAAASVNGFYVLTQGNQYNGLPGEIDYFTLSEDGADVSEMFNAVNKQQLGDTPQKPVIYGSKMYVPVYGSNLLWVLDAKTLRIISKVETNEPEAVCGVGRYVYVTNNDGYVTRVDTATYAKDAPLAIGQNPYGIAAAGGNVYVAISGSYLDNYAAGYKVAVVDPSTFKHMGDIAVGMNPQKMVAQADGDVFVVCNGNSGYGTPAIYPTVYKIDTAKGTASQFCEGGIVALMPATGSETAQSLFVIDSKTDWSTYVTTTTASVYSLDGTKKIASFFPEGGTPVSAIEADANPATGNVFVCTLAEAGGYSKPGKVMEYTSAGQLVKTYDTGVEPYGVVFK